MSAQGFQTGPDVATDWNNLRFVVAQLLARVATCALVRVVACTNNGGVSAVGTVDVQPVVSMVAGDGTVVKHGQLYKLPYVRVQGGANAVILDPQPGDLGLAWFASRDISAVKAAPATFRGTGGQTAPPGSKRQFDMSDGLYMGGLLNAAPTQYVRFSTGGVEVVSPAKITLQAPTIELKGDVAQSGGDITATGSYTGDGDVVGAGVSLQTHTHSGVQSGGSNTGPPNP